MPLPDGTLEYTSVRSPRLKAARRLTKRAFRQRARAFLVEGPQAVTEASRSGAPVTELFVTAEARARHEDLVTAMARAGIPVHTVSGEVMAELAQTVTPQGLLAVCGFVDVPLDQAIAVLPPGAGQEHAPRLAALLASVRDPGNAGTVLRTADAAGAQTVIFSDASVDPYNGKCVRASAGSLFHLPLVAGVPTDRAVSALRGAGLRSSPPTPAAGAPWTSSPRPSWPRPRRGSSATRRGACRPRCSHWPTRASRSPSTAGPRA